MIENLGKLVLKNSEDFKRKFGPLLGVLIQSRDLRAFIYSSLESSRLGQKNKGMFAIFSLDSLSRDNNTKLPLED